MSFSSQSRAKPIGPWLRARYTSAAPALGRRRTILYDPMVSGRGSAGNIHGDPIGGGGVRPTKQGNDAPRRGVQGAGALRKLPAAAPCGSSLRERPAEGAGNARFRSEWVEVGHVPTLVRRAT